MRKIAVIIIMAIFSISSHAFTLIHKHKKNHPMPTLQSTVDEDFSGTWRGQCSDEDVTLKIKQSDEAIRFDTYDGDRLVSSETFQLNGLANSNVTTFKRSEHISRFSYIHQNTILLHLYGLSMSNNSHKPLTFITEWGEVRIVKHGDEISIYDFPESDGPQCVLHRA